MNEYRATILVKTNADEQFVIELLRDLKNYAWIRDRDLKVEIEQLDQVRDMD